MKSIKLLLVLALVFTACKSKYPTLENGLYADIQTNKGDILVKLHHKEVPMTVANFVSLAEGNNPKLADSLQGKPFYDKTKFHRVIKDFMIQGGDPTGTGRGNAGYKFPDEFPLNKEGKLAFSHDSPGVLSMANSGFGTNSCQFYITHKDTPWLDSYDKNGDRRPCINPKVSCHTVFGKVEIGQAIVDSIKQNDVINKIDIIRVGSDAKSFDAPKVFIETLNKYVPFDEKMGINKATETDSGLKYLKLEEGKGVKVNPDLPTTANYTIYLSDGTKIQSTLDTGKPFTFTINKDGLIAGWKEGAKMMKEGEKARLFIPSYIGYGGRGMGPIPPNTDLVFELEILKVGK